MFQSCEVLADVIETEGQFITFGAIDVYLVHHGKLSAFRFGKCLDLQVEKDIQMSSHSSQSLYLLF